MPRWGTVRPPRGTHGGWVVLGTAACVAAVAVCVVALVVVCLVLLAMCAASGA